MNLVLFDLDHTLLSGDSDVLWCAFLVRRGAIDGAEFEARNAEMEAGYRAGTVGAREFCDFYVSTLAGRSAAEWAPVRDEFFAGEIVPRIPATARALVERHRASGQTLVLTTATNRFISEPTAMHLGIEHLIATDCAIAEDGRFSGRTEGVPNMGQGKLERLHGWLAERGTSLADCDTTAYSDSINDLPLLCAVDRAIVVSPDDRLAAEAQSRGWQRLDLLAR